MLPKAERTRHTFFPRFEESRAGLCSIPHDREAAGGTPPQDHEPLGIGEFLRLIDHDMSEKVRRAVHRM